MITRSPAGCQIPPWKRALADAFTSIDALLAFLQIDPDTVADLDPARQPFGMLVPRGFAALMQRGDPNDPLLRQILPLRAEQMEVAGFGTDPVGDAPADQGHGLLQKYQGRALLVTTGACAVHCRYCFRRHYPYLSLGTEQERFSAALEHITRAQDLSEVILSGGDPLLVDDERLAALLDRLEAIPHLRRLRFHTRLATILPERITGHLCERLARSRLGVVMVHHINHPHEIGAAARRACVRLHEAGVNSLNQSVLLLGINDNADTLCNLSERMFECSILPYYLHQLDRVQGAAHFQVTDARACALVETMRARLPGYLVPRLVRELAGAHSKTPIPTPALQENRR